MLTTTAPATFSDAVLAILRADAARWWYHRQFRDRGEAAEAQRREDASVNLTLHIFRQCLANDGYVSIGRGRWTIHYAPGACLSGYGTLADDGTLQAALVAGLPILDLTTAADSALFALVVSGPMLGCTVGADHPDRPVTALSIVGWRTMLAAYQAASATVYNVHEAQ